MPDEAITWEAQSLLQVLIGALQCAKDEKGSIVTAYIGDVYSEILKFIRDSVDDNEGQSSLRNSRRKKGEFRHAYRRQVYSRKQDLL
jgi:hypothetical protein